MFHGFTEYLDVYMYLIVSLLYLDVQRGFPINDLCEAFKVALARYRASTQSWSCDLRMVTVAEEPLAEMDPADEEPMLPSQIRIRLVKISGMCDF